MCAKHRRVLVTKDWQISTAPHLVRELHKSGVSVVWIRHREGNINSRDLLFLLARDLPRIEVILNAASEPAFIVTGLRSRPRQIQISETPTRRSGRPRRRSASS